MRVLILIICLFFFLSRGIAQNLELNVQVFSVNLFTSTGESVSCDNFLSSFKSQIHVKELTSKDTLSEIVSFLKGARYFSKNEQIDTRAKFIIYNLHANESKTEICINNFFVLVNGKKVKRATKFLSFLKACLPAKDITYN